MQAGDSVWCRWEDCGEPEPVVSPTMELPPTCPSCKREGRWTTEKPPSHPYVLSWNDANLLHALKIDPEQDWPDGHLGALDDGG